MFALNFYSPLFVDQLRKGRKTATIRLGDKRHKYKKGQLVWVTVGHRHGPRQKIFTAIVDQVDHKPIRELRPDVPEELGAVVDKCLQKHRENRFSNVAELARALEPFAASTSKSEPRIQLSVTTLALPTVRLDEGAPENELDDDDIEVILDDDDIVQACA